MTRTRSKTLMPLALGCLGALLVASASEGGQLEVLIGHYQCSAGIEDGLAYVAFEGSGDVLLDNDVLYDYDFALAGSPADTCGPEAAAMHATVTSLECTPSSISNLIYDDGGFAASFDFVCRGSRDRVIRSLAEIAGQIIGITGP